MASKRKSWREKLADDKDHPRFFVAEAGSNTARWGTGRFVIPRPRDVDALMKKVPKGKLTTINELRAGVAAMHGADNGCPITTGIFAWIAAHAAVESQADGKVRVTPYWRTLKAGGEINPKYPGGVEAQQKLLEEEGHTVIRKGKRFLVENFEKKVVRSADRTLK